ncbi:hypothetical protein KUL42_00260 [Alteromonas sp. KUL42]|uniref:lasso peptide biosynthesis PqqD family chaperone n=1 Tax=Alteromonas sp. KUL42 TaxID=2480797 RepID=UPI0007947B5B|nr:lasso peptide biosynthesis PqqD family chaperone [Alteromonas sp. KUL42]KXJ60304.1 MAG: hypothetical protein AXW14_13040 [Alteromonas sp. Nap_26]TAP38069.1 lasso peptide biosynthesis PqqD family chaperone [Alteromonas sp. KUL42]GEA05265.1 hypothetical protein KUL42_00260 [Alteromonas sp. KUL42]
MQAPIGKTSLITKNQDIVDASIDGETVMMSLENGEYYGLDPIASMIWDSLHTPLTVDGLIDTLMSEYEVSPETCLKDVLAFLESLRQHNLISVEA